jgi:hypothetical protein
MLSYLIRKNLKCNKEYDELKFKHRMLVLGISIVILLVIPKWISIPVAGIVILGRVLYNKATARS